jgi:ferric iron reductase protein FhuF
VTGEFSLDAIRGLRADPRTPLDEAVYAAQQRFGRMGGSFPIHFRPPTGYEVVPALDLLEVERLRSYFVRAIAEWSSSPSEEDQRAAASRFVRRYAGAIGTAALVPLANGVALDVSLERVSLLIRSNLTLGVVLDLEGSDISVSPDRPTTWPIEELGRPISVPSAADLRDRAFEALFGRNLAPAFERILEAIHVSDRLLWTNAAESIELMYEYGEPNADPAEWAPFEADRRAIHEAEAVAGIDGPNPARGLIEWEDFDDPLVPGPQQMRRVCCANFVIPGRPGKYCRTCGLIPFEERHRLWVQFMTTNRDAEQVPWPPLG